jgi:streptogramin lyase
MRKDRFAGRARAWRVPLVGLTLTVSVLAGPLASRSAATVGAVTEFPSGTGTLGDPAGMTSGPDGNLWFTEYTGDKIGRITPDGTITEFDVPTAAAGPNTITAGPDGNVWFTEVGGNRVARITPAGVITEFSAGITSASEPWGITAGPDGNVWFTEFAADKVARITPSGGVTEYPVTAGSGPRQITAGPDGNLWFTAYTSGKVGRISASGTNEQDFPLEHTGAKPEAIAVGPDGNLWFAEAAVNSIGRMTTTGLTNDWPLPTAGSNPVGITPGLDGNLWFTEFFHNKVGVFNPSDPGGTMQEFSNGIGASSEGVMIATGADGNIWFAEGGAAKVARVQTGAGSLSTAPPSVAGSGVEGTPHTCSPGSWVTWAGHQPTVDGDSWLLDGSFVAGTTLTAYAPPLTGVGHQLACEETVTYPNLDVTFGARSAPVAVTAPPAPTCSNESVNVPNQGSTVRIVLACSGPSGFPLTYAVASAPAHGSLSAVDLSGGAVSYTPAAGYSGTDQFTYGASDDGGASTTATVVITVPASTGSGSSQAAKVTAKISYTFRVVRAKTSFHVLKATGVPAGATVLLLCKGHGCAAKSKRIPVSAKRVADAVAALPKKKRKQGVLLRAGATMTFLVTAPHAIGTALSFKARKNAVPIKRVLCVGPGARTASKC